MFQPCNISVSRGSRSSSQLSCLPVWHRCRAVCSRLDAQLPTCLRGSSCWPCLEASLSFSLFYLSQSQLSFLFLLPLFTNSTVELARQIHHHLTTALQFPSPIALPHPRAQFEPTSTASNHRSHPRAIFFLGDVHSAAMSTLTMARPPQLLSAPSSSCFTFFFSPCSSLTLWFSQRNPHHPRMELRRGSSPPKPLFSTPTLLRGALLMTSSRSQVPVSP